MFKWKKDKSEQRGTLMVEAIAMLGLIAIVTPTLYKKSAERLQEIQDINIATQARTMAGVIETFIRNKASVFHEYIEESGGSVSVFELCKNDGCSSDTGGGTVTHLPNFLNEGYSAAIPYGFKPQDVKYFGEPRVFVVSEEGNIVFYIVYPKQMDLGKRRATRLASLIGAQGGIVTKDLSNSSKVIQGTGGAWELDKDMIENVFNAEARSSLVMENSLVLTNNEPITTKFEDTEKFLYRIPPTDLEDYFHNTMVTDLYLGGNPEDNSLYSSHSQEYYSIFNVRKMTLNTRCTAARINITGGSSDCDPDVADLYIGKPIGKFNEQPITPGTSGAASNKKYGSNNGAAWIYGNLSALNERFRLYNTDYDSSGNTYERTGYDVLQFSHEDTAGTDATGAPITIAGNTVFMASNESSKAQVAMIDGMVRAVENFVGKDGSAEVNAFLVGGNNSSLSEDEGRLITAFDAPTGGRVNINDFDQRAVTRINSRGGDVYINGGDSSATEEITAHTYINPNSGELMAGVDGQWLYAGGMSSSAHVDVFSSGVGNRFTVGGITADSSQIWANSSLTSLRDGAIRAYEFSGTLGNVGGFDLVSSTTYYEDGSLLGPKLTNAAVIGAKYTDVLGSAYFGSKGSTSAVLDDSEPFVRDDWRLTVAGSAWVDDLLFANKAWFNSSGMKELHAGFDRFTEFENSSRGAWLNAYHDGVIIRDRERVKDYSSSGVGGVRPEDTRFYANESTVYMGDSKGAQAHLNKGIAMFGYAKVDSSTTSIPSFENYVGADSSAAFVVGEKLAEIYTSSDDVGDDNVAVDIQKGAMLFQGYSWANDSTRTEHNYTTNTINAHAGEFAIHTREFKDSSGATTINDARSGVFYANSSDVLTRVVDFSVQDNKGEYVLKARPMIENLNSSEANVEVDGSFHVTGNRVIHVASDSSNAAGENDKNPHAVFEVDPRFVKVMALDGNDSTYVAGAHSKPLAMLEVNPYDVSGSSTVRAADGSVDYSKDPTENASVYIRRGAIELERNTGSSWAADEGYGYIKANRFVSNADVGTIPTIRATEGGGDANSGNYDQYMVNPAYTSVMHDIKLTTRGGARLSDILPDYVLKGVYNVSNDFLETRHDKDGQICWSSGRTSNCNPAKVAWADPYVGLIPYASCPPGYRNMATIVPISFEMAQAGDVVSPGRFSYGIAKDKDDRYVVNRTPRQAKVLSADAGSELFYPTYEEVKTFEYNSMVATGADFNPAADIKVWTDGWYLGLSADTKYDNGTVTADSDMKWDSSRNVALYKKADSTGVYQVVAEPLYFQQNTFLKTTLKPTAEGWEGRMGFLYDRDVYKLGTSDSWWNDGILSNNNPKGYNDSSRPPAGFGLPGTWVWNLFPVPTNTLEGHATVYCYFDRQAFLGDDPDGAGSKWQGLIDPIDQINHLRRPDSSGLMDKNTKYKDRLNDPTLKYSDPW